MIVVCVSLGGKIAVFNFVSSDYSQGSMAEVSSGRQVLDELHSGPNPLRL